MPGLNDTVAFRRLPDLIVVASSFDDLGQAR